MKYLNRAIVLSLFLLGASCGGGGGGDDEPTPIPVPDPKAATLTFPANNEACNEGTNVNDTQSSVTFQWSASQDTDSYEVNLKNLSNNSTTKTNANTNQATITILRGTPYEWFVVSKATGTNKTATSSTWKFYNQGAGVENYAPFPAEAISPKRGETIESTTTVSLKWEGSDVDNDISDYEVFFGTDTNTSTSLGTTTNTTLDATVSSGSTYYWKVITKDSQDNTSDSEVFEFKVN